MTHNIEELAYRAAEKTQFLNPLTEWQRMSSFLEAFAELVVEDCTLEVNRYIADVGGIICSLPEHVLQDRFDI